MWIANEDIFNRDVLYNTYIGMSFLVDVSTEFNFIVELLIFSFEIFHDC